MQQLFFTILLKPRQTFSRPSKLANTSHSSHSYPNCEIKLPRFLVDHKPFLVVFNLPAVTYNLWFNRLESRRGSESCSSCKRRLAPFKEITEFQRSYSWITTTACSLPFERARASKRAREDTCLLGIFHKERYCSALVLTAVMYLPFGICRCSRWASEIVSVQKLNQLLKTDQAMV